MMLQIKRVHEKGGIMMCKLKGCLDMEEHYYRLKLKGLWKRWHYDVQIKRADG